MATSPIEKSASKTEAPGKKLLISAGLTWVYELGIGHYLEFLKIVKQTKQGSYLQLTREITAQKGFIGIWDGFFPWGTVQALAKGSVFGWGHAIAKRSLEPYVVNKQLSSDFSEIVAGGVGGGFQGLVLSPLLLLKTRVMTDPIFRNNMTMVETTKQSTKVGLNVIKKEGISALMKGSIIFSGKRVADWSTRYFFSVQVENLLFKRNNNNLKLAWSEKMLSSLLGGCLSAFATIPIDVMVAQIQQASKAGTKVSVFQLLNKQLENGGVKGIVGFVTQGFVARVLHVALTTMLLKTGASVFYELFNN